MRRAALLCILVATIALGLATPVIAQPPSPGSYELDWAILHQPASSDLPALQADTRQIELEHAAGTGLCPASSAFVVRNAPAFSFQGGGSGSMIWCIRSDGTFDGVAAGNPPYVGRWDQYTATHAIIEAEQGSRSNDKVMAVARRPESPPPPPPPSAVKVFITQPRTNETVSATAWVVMWVEGTSGSSNVFTLSANGTQVGTVTTSSRGPVTLPWNTRSVANGTHTLGATVRDAAGNTGSTSITVIVRN
jgi:hypothetical protein